MLEKFRVQNGKQGLKESMNFSKKVNFFVKIHKKHTHLCSMLAGLLCMKPIVGPKTGVGFGLNWVCFTSVRGGGFCS